MAQFGNGRNNGFAQHDGQLNNNSFTETLSCHLTGLHFNIAMRAIRVDLYIKLHAPVTTAVTSGPASVKVAFSPEAK